MTGMFQGASYFNKILCSKAWISSAAANDKDALDLFHGSDGEDICFELPKPQMADELLL